MSYDWRGKVVVATGASSGIGRAIALDLSARGAVVVAAARRADLLAAVAAEAKCEAVVTDVADRTSCEALVRGTIARHGRLDVLVNNAGIPMRIHAARLTPENVERAMQVNFMGAVYATLAALPSMIERRAGHVVNVASVAGRVGNPREAAYTASKFAMTGWSEVLAADLDATGVRVHVVYPGPIATEIWDKLDETARWKGKFYPPEVVARAVRAVVERDTFERWAPRKFGNVRFARMLFPNQFVKGLARFDRRAENDGARASAPRGTDSTGSR
jgi:NAD(P)-dependent dehydrogenase (short-subunit alcohol dehydrogenase family)